MLVKGATGVHGKSTVMVAASVMSEWQMKGPL